MTLGLGLAQKFHHHWAQNEDTADLAEQSCDLQSFDEVGVGLLDSYLYYLLLRPCTCPGWWNE